MTISDLKEQLQNSNTSTPEFNSISNEAKGLPPFFSAQAAVLNIISNIYADF